MGRTFSIITASMGRLAHLKLSLPKMLAQPCREVIVVDFSCPQGTGDYVREHFPSALVVSVEGEAFFSNWKARNAGASVATADVLVFCDADTILADDAIERLAAELPADGYGVFARSQTAQFNNAGRNLAKNQLRGFQAIPAAEFRRAGGYDEVLEGYAAGGDTDLGNRLQLMGAARCPLDPAIVASVIEHGNLERTEHHADAVATSYCAGLLYRTAKLALLGLSYRPELPLERRRRLYETARKTARSFGPGKDSASMTVNVDLGPILMPRQLGFEKGRQKLSLTVDVALDNRLDAIPD